MNRIYLSRVGRRSSSPTAMCWLRLALGAGILAAAMGAAALWILSRHLLHAFPALLGLAAVTLLVLLAAALITLAARRGRKSSTASLIVCDSTGGQAWLILDYALTGDPKTDISAANALVESESFQQYPDLTRAAARFENGEWVLEGIGRNGRPEIYALGPAYQAIGEPPLPPDKKVFWSNVLCGILLAAAILAGAVFLYVDNAAEYRGTAAALEELSAIVAQQYPDYEIYAESAHPGRCSVSFKPTGRQEDYFNGAYYGNLYLSLYIDNGQWSVYSFSSSNWYIPGYDYAPERALSAALDPEYSQLSLSDFDTDLAGLEAEYDALLSATDPEDYSSSLYTSRTIARSEDYKQSIDIMLQQIDNLDYYTDVPEDMRGTYYFSYGNFHYQH